MDLAFLVTTFGQLLHGLPITLLLSAVAVSLGAVLALLLTGLREGFALAAPIVKAYVFAVRGSPLLIQMFMVYYGLGQIALVRESFLWPLLREPVACAIIALVLNTAAYGSEILRGGLRAVPRGAIEAGRTAGMSNALLIRRVILPLAIRQALPAYGNEIIIMMKATSLASIITVMEVTGIAQHIIATTFRPFEVFGCAAIIYLGLTFLISRILALVERRLSPWESRLS